MSTQLLSIVGLDSASLSVPQSATDRRDELALSCGTVKTVVNLIQAEHAAVVLKEVKNFTRLLEDSRKLVKEPVLELGKRIDTLAKELTTFLDAEAVRISKLIGTFQAEQARLIQEAQAKAYQEEQRILREAEAKCQEAELMSKTAAQAERRIDKIEAKAFEQIANTRAAAGALLVAKPTGISTRTTVKFEVTDIHALYAARPELVKLEPNTSVINAVLRGAPRASIPGLRVWEEVAAVVR